MKNYVTINGNQGNTAIIYRTTQSDGTFGAIVSTTFTWKLTGSFSTSYWHYIGYLTYPADTCYRATSTTTIPLVATRKFVDKGCYLLYYAQKTGNSYSCGPGTPGYTAGSTGPSGITSGQIFGAVYVTDYAQSPTTSPTKSPQ